MDDQLKTNVRIGYFISICYLLFLVITQGSAWDDLCSSKDTCGECIREPHCAWCNKENDQPHCHLRNKNPVNYCPLQSLVNPTPIFKIIVPRRKNHETMTLDIQIGSLSDLRIGQPFNFTLTYKAVKNYPVDLYYLMDVSLSMLDDKANLVSLGECLVDTMKTITPEFKIGFGSFVDKNILPFVERVTDPSEDCGSQYDCVTYSFRNQLLLSGNVKDFISAVDSTRIVRSGFDVPEGGFDALLQAIVCKDQIGWRDRSRHLIVFATDAYSHLAGNGKFGGILKPNDGKCHLETSNDNYLEAENQDYPSLGQISRVVVDNNINLIFAVTKDPMSSYQEFSKYIPGSSVSFLAGDSQNVVDIIRTKLEQMSSSVEMTDTAGPGVKIRYYSACTGSDIQERNKCENVKVDDVVEFIISIEATICSGNKTEHKQMIEIKPLGMNETMKLELVIICDCPCETPGNSGYISNSVECHNGGDLQCGICNCDSLHSGTNCECSTADKSPLNEPLCKANNTNELCSNRGDCVCDNCECHGRPDPLEVISGKYCECDNFSCARANGNICSNHGKCKCGQCQCNAGWEGIDCSCATSKEKCIPLGGTRVCSGNGICECGSCICKAGAHGTFCQNCPTCPIKCYEFTPCVQCKVFKTGPYMNGICDKVCTYSIYIEDTLEFNNLKISERYCSYSNKSNFIVSFAYGYDDATGAKQVRVKREPDDPPPSSVLAVVSVLLGAIVGLGIIALLSYKTYTYFHDKREYARFKKGIETTMLNQPIGEQPIVQ